MRGFLDSSIAEFLVCGLVAVSGCNSNDATSIPGTGGTNPSSAGSNGTPGSTSSAGSGGSGGSVNGSGGSSGSGAGNDGNGGPADSGMGSGDAQKESGTSDAAPTYNPCPSQGTPCVVMGLGDSITDGVGGTGGSYRPSLFHLALGKQQSITFVGSGMNGPNTVDNVPFPKGHEGHSGFTIDDGAGRMGIHNLTAPAMIRFHPHIITLMIGTNDVDLNIDLANAPRRLGGDPLDAGSMSLMDTIFTTDPNVLLVVAQIVPTTSDDTNLRVRAFNDAIPALVKKHADAGKHVILVDMYSAFTANANYKTEYMNDGLHPNDTGYMKMADIWYAAIGPLFR